MKPRYVALTILLIACEQPSQPQAPRASTPRQQQAVEAMGLTEYRDTGAALWGCSEDDSVLASNTFTAVGRNGQAVSGTVCCGLILKGCTVRW